MDRITVTVTRLAHGDGMALPAYKTDGAAGMDIAAAVPEDTPLAIAPGERVAVPTGFQIALPEGYRGPGAPALGPRP